MDIITGIAPAIAIEQKVNTRNPRSTVGTTTEIYDYLKLLFARAGHTFSPVSGQEVRCFSVDDVAARILARDGQRVVIGAPLVLGEGQGIIEKLTLLLSEGLMRVYTGGEVRLIEDVLPGIGPDTRADEIRIVVDRMRVATDEDSQTRIRDSVARAFSYGGGICEIVTDEGVREFSSRFEADGIEFERPSEHLFSFNNPLGACPRCEGYGKVIGIDEDLVIPDKSKTIYEDAVACWRGETMRKWKQQLVENASKFGFPIHTPFHELTPEQKRLLWRGNEYFHGLDEFFEYIDSERRKIQFRVMKARYTGKTACPECGGLLNQFGTGTQKLEEHLREALPDVEILRMDADSVSPAGSHEKILSQFREKKVPILIGTQMVTKGLDFENVTLVGVISADQLLYCGDYRAGERCFSLITQVVGRSGRGAKPGRAIIQTFTPQNPVIGMASRQDYEGFYAEEIELRRLQNCPPFSDIVTVTVSAEDESAVLRCCTYIRDRIRSELRGRKDAAVLGPAPLPVVRVSNRYRYRVTLHCRFDKEIRTLVSGLLIQCNTAKEYKGVSVFADYNPME